MQTRKALKRLSKGNIRYDDVTIGGPIFENAKWLLENYEKKQASIKESQNRHEVAAAAPILEIAKRKLEKMAGNQIKEDVPLVTRFDAFSVIKDASRQYPNDIGLKRFAIHLERLWHKEPLGTLSANTVTRLRDHYQVENPRSKVAEVTTTTIPKVAFNNLPIAKLTRIASEIETQEDYDAAIQRYNFHGDTIDNIRIRAFIRELVNRKMAQAGGVPPSTTPSTPGASTSTVPSTPSPGASTSTVPSTPAPGASTSGYGAGNEYGEFKEKFEEVRAPEPPLLEGLGIQEGKGTRFARSDIAARVANRIRKTAEEHEVKEKCGAEEDKDDVKSDKNEMGVDGTGIMSMASSSKYKTWKGKDEKPPKGAEYRAPKAWFDKMKAEQKKKNPDYSDKRISEIVGDIWDNQLSEKKRKEIMSQHGEEAKSKKKGQKDAYTMDPATYISPEDYGSYSEQIVEYAKKYPSEKIAQEAAKYVDINAPDASSQLAMSMYNMDEKGVAELQRLVSLTRPLIQQETEEMEVAAQKKKETSVMEPKVNEQQPDQVSVGDEILIKEMKLTQKRPSMKASIKLAQEDIGEESETEEVISDEEPITSEDIEFSKALEEILSKSSPEELEETPEEIDEMTSDEEEIKPEVSEEPEMAMAAAKQEIENMLLSDVEYVKRGYKIGIDKNNIVNIHTKSGTKQYPLSNMDDAVGDFLYLTGNTKKAIIQPPPPMFYVREGIRMTCPGCGNSNSYEMPKTASDMSCAQCDIIIPVRAISGALETGVAKEETTLVAVVPNALQEFAGNIFARAASMIGAEQTGVDGNQAEAYAVDASIEKKAEMWDYLTKSGFQPIAQVMPDIEETVSMDEALPGMGIEPADDAMQEMRDSGEPDEAVIETAMKHYKNKSHDKGDPLTYNEAVDQFYKDYDGKRYDSEKVTEMSRKVFGMGKMAAGDIPSTNVNQQQPDAESIGKDVLGPDSDTHGEISTPKKVNPHVPAQSQQGTSEGDPDIGTDSDTMDPKDFGAGKPKAQHPATDQKGVSVSPTDLGKDSETEMGKTMKKMDQESGAAPTNMRSK